MEVERTVDAEIIKEVLCHPEIFPLIVGECPIAREDYEPPMRNVAYFVGHKDNELIGIVGIHPFWDGVKYHPNVLPNKRKYANEFIRKTIEALHKPLYVEIPERLEKLAIRHDFQEIHRDEKILMRLL